MFVEQIKKIKKTLLLRYTPKSGPFDIALHFIVDFDTVSKSEFSTRHLIGKNNGSCGG